MSAGVTSAPPCLLQVGPVDTDRYLLKRLGMNTEATPSAAIPTITHTTGRMNTYMWRLVLPLEGVTVVLPSSMLLAPSGREGYCASLNYDWDSVKTQARFNNIVLY